MGQKVHPTGYRIAVIEPWRSRWYANKRDFSRLLKQDQDIRRFIQKEFKGAGIPRIEIERTSEAVNVIVHTARPGVLVGRKGVRVEQLKKELQEIAGITCHLTVREIKRPELESTLVAEVVAEALEKRMAFRRAMKKALQTTMQAGAKGVKIEMNGRLGGAEMAREAKEREGRVPLTTLRSYVDYGTAEAKTSYGVIGVKVWIYKGDLDRGQKLDYRFPLGGVVKNDRTEMLQSGGGRGPGRPRSDRGDRGDRGDRPDRGGERGDRRS
jgi:small subunit ribosomal protein S3